LKELKELAAHESEIIAAQLNVLFLNVDGVAAAATPPSANAARLLERIGFPFRHGSVTAESLSKIDLLLHTVFDQQQPSVVPISYLIDRGNLAVIYRGRVTAETLLRDVADLGASAGERRQWSVPFAGRWFTRPSPLNLGELAESFRQEFPDEAVRYLRGAIRQLGTQQARDDLSAHVRRRFELRELQAYQQLIRLCRQLRDMRSAAEACEDAIRLARRIGHRTVAEDLEKQLEQLSPAEHVP
jgi:hypothetical protein